MVGSHFEAYLIYFNFLFARLYKAQVEFLGYYILIQVPGCEIFWCSAYGHIVFGFLPWISRFI